MTALQHLLSLPAAEQARLGVEATPAEIAQQPLLWRDTAARVAAAAPELRALLGRDELIFAGAGTSDFVGRCLQGPVSAARGARALAVPTTDIVTHPEFALPSSAPAVLVSFARSGNSPESGAALEVVRQERPEVRHLIITCNAEGELARRAAELGDRAYALVLDARTNDRGLAMTSSFTSMVTAGLGLAYLDDVDEYVGLVDRMAGAGEQVLAQAPAITKALADKGPTRACFLGSGALLGAATECHLKLQELTNGGVICFYDSFLGLRHGPRAAIDTGTLVVAFLSSAPHVRRYEVDLLRSNRRGGLGLAHLLVVDRATEELRGLADAVVETDPTGALALPDSFAPPVATVVGQLLGVFASLHRGLKPDAPSAAGTISRVVQGVTIYPWEHNDQ